MEARGNFSPRLSLLMDDAQTYVIKITLISEKR